jgi:hypothetical protein
MGKVLSKSGKFLRDYDMPYLNVLVIGENTKRPGFGINEFIEDYTKKLPLKNYGKF